MRPSDVVGDRVASISVSSRRPRDACPV